MRAGSRAVGAAAAVLSFAALSALGRAQEVAPPGAAPARRAARAPGNLTEASPPEAAPPAIQVAPEPQPERPAIPAPPPKPPEPLKRARQDAAILQATDKITAETLRFEAMVGAPVRFKDLVVTVRACETTAADEPVKDSVAHLDVVSQPVVAPGRSAPARPVFRGWMFAGSPGLHPFEHPVYDLWLIACRTAAPTVSAGRP